MVVAEAARDTGAQVVDPSDLRPPCRCLQVELCAPLPDLQGHGTASDVWILVRLDGRPIGSLTLRLGGEPVPGDALGSLIGRELGPAIVSRLERRGRGWSGDLPLPHDPDAAPPERGPSCTVVVCTRERPQGLRACLQSLLDMRYGDFSVLVVDNAPVTGATAEVVAAMGDERVRYTVAPEPGLSNARNHALGLVDSDVVAWIDDDELADPEWIARIAAAFADHPGAAAVFGAMVPAELDTQAQIWFEQYGGHNKLRGFVPAVFSPSTWAQQHPVYPLPPFGTGGNMAFAVDALREIGPFDALLGAGAPGVGAEDTLAITKLLLAGHTAVYEPAALTFHFHRRTVDELERQMSGYGVGLSAYYTALLLWRPRLVLTLTRLLPLVWRDFVTDDSLRSGGLPRSFPRHLLAANRRGLAAGPWRYGTARFRRWRAGR